MDRTMESLSAAKQAAGYHSPVRNAPLRKKSPLVFHSDPAEPAYGFDPRIVQTTHIPNRKSF